MHVPDKYKKIETFWKYYAGVKVSGVRRESAGEMLKTREVRQRSQKAPVLTLFIGGNHEASAYMSELPNGGWVSGGALWLKDQFTP